jgi:hypothetical protein
VDRELISAVSKCVPFSEVGAERTAQEEADAQEELLSKDTHERMPVRGTPVGLGGIVEARLIVGNGLCG